MRENDSQKGSKGSHKGGLSPKGKLQRLDKYFMDGDIQRDAVQQNAQKNAAETTDVADCHRQTITRRRISLRLALSTALAFAIICYYLAVPLIAKRQDEDSGRSAAWSPLAMSQRHKNILDCSGPYTPFYPTNLNYPQPDFSGESYELSQVVILQRHTARYPVHKAYHRIKKALRKIRRLPDPSLPLQSYIRELEAWDSEDKLGMLTDNGREMADRFGQVYAERYPAFTTPSIGVGAQLPFVRSSGSPRVVESGGFLINALQGKPFALVNDAPLPLPDVVFATGSMSQDHNPIGEKGCQRGKYKYHQREGTRIPKRYLNSLSEFVLPHLEATLGSRDGHQLEPIDAAALMSLCAYTSQQKASYTTGASPSMWCDLFEGLDEEQEIDIWRRYAYWYDVTKWYVKGQGNPATRNAGIGWINELVARLTDSHVTEFTDTNRTLDTDPTTFPQGGQRMFIDLSHDNRMLAILTAMGILHRNTSFSERYDPSTRSEYDQGKLSPFGMNLIIERFSPSSNGADDFRTHKPEVIRMLLNDVPVVPSQVAQESITGSPFMTLEQFVDSQTWASGGGEWMEYCAHDSTSGQADEDDEDALELSDSSG